jgi:hypothetical protein
MNRPNMVGQDRTGLDRPRASARQCYVKKCASLYVENAWG